jgi:hypothetical protein
MLLPCRQDLRTLGFSIVTVNGMNRCVRQPAERDASAYQPCT